MLSLDSISHVLRPLTLSCPASTHSLMSCVRAQVDRNGKGLTANTSNTSNTSNTKLTEHSINVARLVEKGDDGYQTDGF